jgi:DNA-binding transcriptional regulator LsrR (DeoR family)
MDDTSSRAISDSKATDAGGPWTPSVLFAAAKMYYEDDATQAEIAARIGVSRPTVSRLLSEARRQGIVKITVIEPAHEAEDELRRRVEGALNLRRVYLTVPLPVEVPGGNEEYLGKALGPAVGRALIDAGLGHGDALLVSSGRTLYEVARTRLPQFPGVVVAPAIGGIDQPEDWYQTNEITRLFAAGIGGRAQYLFAPALPGPSLHRTLRRDPTIQRVLRLWPQARVVLTGVGAAPMLRAQVPQYAPTGGDLLWEAVGDVCGRFFDRAGSPVDFPGSDRLIALELADLRELAVVVAVAAGLDKVTPIIVGARAGYFNQLVTDPLTAEQILARAAEGS